MTFVAIGALRVKDAISAKNKHVSSEYQLKSITLI